jgi:pimeloyl-ACP methyl ester carboxylesterase
MSTISADADVSDDNGAPDDDAVPNDNGVSTNADVPNNADAPNDADVSHDGTTDADEPQVVTLDTDGSRQVAYAEYGTATGDPVVFLHGTPGSRRLGALFETAARRADVRLLAPDRPGYGLSSPRPDRTVRDTAAVVETVLEDAGVDTADLLAFSGGSPYALTAAAQFPDRVGTVDVVAGAVPPSLRTTTPFVQRLLGRLARTAPWLLRRLVGGQAWLADRSPGAVVAQYTDTVDDEFTPDAGPSVFGLRAVDESDGESHTRTAKRTEVESRPGPPETAGVERATASVRVSRVTDATPTVAADFREAVATSRQGVVTEFRHAVTGWDVSLAAVDAPVTLWHGDRDGNVPIDGPRQLAARLPNARLRVVEGADHLRTLLAAVPAVVPISTA